MHTTTSTSVTTALKTTLYCPWNRDSPYKNSLQLRIPENLARNIDLLKHLLFFVQILSECNFLIYYHYHLFNMQTVSL